MEFPHTTVIPVTTDISGRKNMKFLWNDGANALVNLAEGIVLQRQNVVNSAGEIKDGINIAYAFEAGVSAEQRRRVVWIYTLPNGQIVDAWLDASDLTKKWNFQLQTWENI